MRVAVLGAGGFIGNRTVEMLHLGGRAEVRPIVGRASGLALPARFALDCRVADARDEDALARAFARCDAVVHAVAGDTATILGTLEPAYRAAERAGIRRLVYLGSASVHGQAPAPGTDERTPLRDDREVAYNNAKVRAERTLAALRAAGRVEVVVLRPAIVIGPRSAWIGRFADALLAGEAALVNRGRGICNAVYVDNLVDAIVLALTCPRADRETFLVNDPERVTWADVYRPVAAAFGVDLDALPEASVPAAPPGWHARARRLRRAPGTRALAAVLPRPLKRRIANALGVADAAPDGGAWAVRARTVPAVTQEMALLYSCGYKLPATKAAEVLGWTPSVSFAEACRRTVGWLAFAGYPVRGAS